MKIKKALPQKYFLSSSWNLRKSPSNSIPPAINFPKQGIPACVPGTVHTDLLAAGLIPDPFFGMNEKKLKWIHKNDWIYETIFDLPQDFRLEKQKYLVCEGLDTVCEIRLNGKVLGETNNMFCQYKFLIDSCLKEQDNHLQIYFHSPGKAAQYQENKYGKLWGANNTERVFLRKAQYSFGWDWGPSFPTMGIWQPIYLYQSDTVHIRDVRFHTSRLHDKSAVVMIEINMGGQLEDAKLVEIELKNKDQVIQGRIEKISSGFGKLYMEISNPRLWYPNGEGNPNLYDLKVSLIDQNNHEVDDWASKVGLRTIALETISKGKPCFRFIINGIPFFIKGSNWIPADSFLPRVTSDKYHHLLKSAKAAGMNMIRVWGGGIYENNIFYEVCDRLGLLVWQDFMFACGHYPEHQNFVTNIEEEFHQNINRLQHHPSIALWCGNNENEWGWYMDHGTPVENMPGYRIYHQIIPGILKKLDPLRPYWPTSPFGSEIDPNSEKSGNRHQWDIWSSGVDYTEVKADKSLFVSEFGFQGPANRTTLERALPESDWHAQAPSFLFHNKQNEGPRLLTQFLNNHLPEPNTWKDFIYLTQLNQGFALKTCIEHWRSRWPKTAGCIIWQINDCWPVVSWSLIDSELKPKMAYYLVREAFSQILICFQSYSDNLFIVGLNSTQNEFKGKLGIYYWDSETSQKLKTEEHPVKMKSNVVSKIFSFPFFERSEEKNRIIIATLFDENGRQIHRNVYSQTRWKHLNLPQANVNINFKGGPEGKTFGLTSDLPAFFIDLFHPECSFSNRGFTLLPEEKLKIHVTGNPVKKFNIDKVQIFMLNKYLRT